MPNQITMKVLIVQIPLMVAKPNRPVYGCSEVALFYITGDAEFHLIPHLSYRRRIWRHCGTSKLPPQALTGTHSEPFMLAFIRGNISVCFGCKQRYPNPINPPGDLCIMHKEWRLFTLPGSSAPQSQFGNAYYHLHLPCIWSMWPQFDP